MEISMFGVLTIRDGDRVLHGRSIGASKPRGLLELLLLARGRPVTKDALAEALWAGATPPRDAFRTLEHYMCVLRKRLCDDRDLAQRVFATGPNSYRVDVAHVALDVDRFDALVREAEIVDAADRRRLLTEAVELAKDDLLADSTFASWAAFDRDLYRERVARAHLWIAGDCLLDGDMHTALRHCDEALRFAPYCERAFRLSMIANYALGLGDLARSTYLRCRAVLGSGLNVDPTSETVSVAAAIDAGAPLAELIAQSPAALV